MVFVCKQKTAYEMRISDWSSDVCSSDLGIISKGLIVIAGDVDHMGPGLGHFQDAPEHVVVRGRPVPAPFQTPSVADVADEIELLALDRFQAIEKQLRVAAARPQMDIGDPDRPELEARPEPRIMFGLGTMDPGGQRMGRGAVAAAMPCAGERRCRLGRSETHTS